MKKFIPIISLVIFMACQPSSKQKEIDQKISRIDSLILVFDNKIIEFDDRLLEESKLEIKRAITQLKAARTDQDLVKMDSALSVLSSIWKEEVKVFKMNNRPIEMVSVWSAKWETPPESYPDLTDTEFFMNGEFTFTQDSLKIENNGFPGCIFNVDTIAHTQSWYVSNDTLFLYNDPEVLGMSYLIKKRTRDSIKLQLMDDIFVTLSKQSL